jgi:alpha,alpha-trehalase
VDRVPVRLAAFVVLAAIACQTSAPRAARYDPSRDLGPLFQDVQLSGIFPDSKTFVDARPLAAPAAITARFATARTAAGFSLQAFVQQYFELPQPAGASFRTDPSQTMEQHIRALWPVLTRAPPQPSPSSTGLPSSLIPLPQPYVVPGGRFREIYYWDSYFTMLGLVASGRADLVRDMLDNFAYLIATVGHIPNGNRTYYLSRSQPPYFGAMVSLYAAATDTVQALRYLDALEAEHAFWMDGAERLAPGQAYRRVVKLADGSVLNRYWDDRDPVDPRPESFRPDYQLAQTLPEAGGGRAAFYRNIRATAESGWDFSSRWLRDPRDLRSLETTDLVPVDLNSLLYHAERTIAALRAFRGQPGDSVVAQRFAAAADARRRALLAAAYDSATGFFYDVRWRPGGGGGSGRVTDRPTLAAAAPLYFGLATPDQGRAVAARLAREFLKPGGFVTTLIASGQQWDAPNGWPPLEWLAIEGVRRYGRADLAAAARERWLALLRRTYRATGKMMEKYDVVDLRRRAGGGEYPTQDGFGWTNGVVLALESSPPDPLSLRERGNSRRPPSPERSGGQGVRSERLIPPD